MADLGNANMLTLELHGVVKVIWVIFGPLLMVLCGYLMAAKTSVFHLSRTGFLH